MTIKALKTAITSILFVAEHNMRKIGDFADEAKDRYRAGEIMVLSEYADIVIDAEEAIKDLLNDQAQAYSIAAALEKELSKSRRGPTSQTDTAQEGGPQHE